MHQPVPPTVSHAMLGSPVAPAVSSFPTDGFTVTPALHATQVNTQTSCPPYRTAGVVYGSTSSSEEQVDGLGLPCCNFRGAVYAVRLYDGGLLWRWYAVPENGGQYGGWSGNAVWGSQPAIDAKRRLVGVANRGVEEGEEGSVATVLCVAASLHIGCLVPYHP